MINIPYRLSNWLGRRNRRRFAAMVHRLPPVTISRQAPLSVYAFSSQNDWLEQAASIRSFLRFVGRPLRFVVMSDGTHDTPTREALSRIDPSVSILDITELFRPDLPEAVKLHASLHPFGKKLAAQMSFPLTEPTIYADSDILFFPGASALCDLAGNSPCRYLQDCSFSLDPRLVSPGTAHPPYANAGFTLFNHPLDWRDSVARLAPVAGEPNFFTEQTIVHLTLQSNGAQPLPEDTFVLKYDDQFQFGDRYAGTHIALRHYISSIRTKMWHHLDLFC